MFTPLDILYIVLSFCALWLTAIIFWFIWQAATMIKRANDTIGMVQETLDKIENALDGIHSKFGVTATTLGAVVNTATKAVEHFAMRRKKEVKEESEPKKKRSTRTRKKRSTST